MGIFNSKSVKSSCTNSPVSKTDRINIEDPRSPTNEISRTPITADKKPYLETNLDDILFGRQRKVPVCHKDQPLRTRLLKSLKTDPRSPTVGIDRTPILIDESPAPSKSQPYWESPISIYSSNFIEDDFIADVTAPPDPSVNVSDFEDNVMNFSQEIDNLVDELTAHDFLIGTSAAQEDVAQDIGSNTEELVSMNEENTRKPALRVADKPNTSEAIKLLSVIEGDGSLLNDTDESGSKHTLSFKKSKIPKRVDNNSLNQDKYVKRMRAPLSNITSSANSPNQAPLRFVNSKNIRSECGVENSPRSQNQIVEWDQDSTVII